MSDRRWRYLPDWLRFHLMVAGMVGVLSTMILFLGMGGFFSARMIMLLHFLAIGTLMAWLVKHRVWERLTLPKEKLSVTEKIALFFLVLFVTLTVVAGLVPPFGRDALIHHLAIPRLFLRWGRIVDIPFAEQAYNPMLGDLLYTLPIAWFERGTNGDVLSASIHYLFGLGTAHLLFCCLREVFGRKAGLLGAALFLSLPVVMQSGREAYVDLTVTYYAFLSWVVLFYVFQWIGKVQRPADLALHVGLAGTMAGFAMASKYNGFLLLPLSSLMFFLGLQRLKMGQKGSLGFVTLFVSGAVLMALPWLWRNYLWTGDPVFPFFRNELGNRALPPEALGSIPALLHRTELYHETWLDIVALPLRIFFTGREGDPQQFDGRLSPVLLLFLPAAFLAKDARARNVRHAILFLIGFYFCYVAFFRILRMRYLLPIVPLMVVLTLIGWQSLGGYARKIGSGILLLCLGIHLAWFVPRFQELQVWDFLSGKLSRQKFLTDRLPEYSVQCWANENLKSEDRILFVLLGDRGYYSEVSYQYDFHDPGRSWRRWLSHSRGSEDLAAHIQREEITHIMTSKYLFQDAIRKEFWLSDEKKLEASRSYREILQRFVVEHTKVIFENAEVELREVI